MERSEGLQGLIERLAPHPEAWKKPGICAVCGGAATEFKDDLSLQEYQISRMCQTCQDGVFGS